MSTLGFDQEAVRQAELIVVEDSDGPNDTEALLVKILISNKGARSYRSDDPETGGRTVEEVFPLLDPQTGTQQTTWGAQDPCVYEADDSDPSTEGPRCLDSRLIFGGPFPWESGLLALSDMADAGSWE